MSPIRFFLHATGVQVAVVGVEALPVCRMIVFATRDEVVVVGVW